MDSDIKVTVLTPTFNRAHTLPRLYDSLCRQTDRRFVWLIVDDGSSDQTGEAAGGFEGDFEIQYIYKENGGKHTAVNAGVEHVHTEYTFIVDSDDHLREHAIKLVNGWIEETSGITGLAGIAGLKANESGDIIGQFPDHCEYIDCLNSERRKYRLMGDKAEIYKTELLKSHPFPVYADERFMPESVIWNLFSLEGLKVRWYKKCIEVCEYREDGLTSSMKNMDHFRDNFKGYRDDCIMNLKVLEFPYNYSAVSVFYARCCAAGKREGCLDDLGLSSIEKNVMRFMGRLRCQTGRY